MRIPAMQHPISPSQKTQFAGVSIDCNPNENAKIWQTELDRSASLLQDPANRKQYAAALALEARKGRSEFSVDTLRRFNDALDVIA